MGFPSETLTIGSLFNYVLLLTNFLLDVRVVPKSDFDKNRNLFFASEKSERQFRNIWLANYLCKKKRNKTDIDRMQNTLYY